MPRTTASDTGEARDARSVCSTRALLVQGVGGDGVSADNRRESRRRRVGVGDVSCAGRFVKTAGGAESRPPAQEQCCSMT